MFNEMRRQKSLMNDIETLKLLEKGIDGVLGTVSSNGYPYTVPVNYVYFKGKIYFHSALTGHKLDNILANEKVSFTVITKNEIIQEKFSTRFKSVILFGKAKLIENDREILLELIKKYSLPFVDKAEAYIAAHESATQLVEITIDHITGKQTINK